LLEGSGFRVILDLKDVSLLCSDENGETRIIDAFGVQLTIGVLSLQSMLSQLVIVLKIDLCILLLPSLTMLERVLYDLNYCWINQSDISEFPYVGLQVYDSYLSLRTDECEHS
jgi:hypothetical protein